MKRPDPYRESILFKAAVKRRKRVSDKRNFRKLERLKFRHFSTILQAPYIVSLEHPNHHAAVTTFCAKLRKSIFHEKKSTLIDFSLTNKFVAGGTLLIYSEISRLLELTSNKVRVNCLAPRNNKASQVLKQIGMYRLFKKRVAIRATSADVVRWCVATGVGADGSKFEPVLGAYDGKITHSLSTGLFNNITEAMTNTGQHAFIKPRKDGISLSSNIVQRWWMFSQERDGFLSVVFCDLGAGIPETLDIKYPTITQNLRAKLGLQIKDSAYLSEAIKLGNSRTGKAFRGKGLYRMARLFSHINEGQLLIYSNAGRLSVKNNQVVATDYSKSLLGTIIFFMVPLDADPVIYEH